MKKMDVGKAIQIVANIGVIAGIALVAIEIHQNNELLTVQIRANALNRVVGTTDIVLQSPDLVDLLGKKEEALTQSQRDRLVVLGIRLLTTFQSSFSDVESGLQDETSLRRAVSALWNRPRLNYGIPLAWEEFKQRADPRFVAWMEENIVNGGAERPQPGKAEVP